jgi:hypothetical protein
VASLYTGWSLYRRPSAIQLHHSQGEPLWKEESTGLKKQRKKEKERKKIRERKVKRKNKKIKEKGKKEKEN